MGKWIADVPPELEEAEFGHVPSGGVIGVCAVVVVIYALIAVALLV